MFVFALFFFALFYFCLFSFLCFLIQKKTLFFPRKGHFVYFECFSLSPLAFFGLPLFLFLFLCLSLVFFSLFLPSCLSFLLSFGSLFLSLSFLSFLLCFCFMKGTTSKYSMAIVFFINLFSLFGFLSCFFFQIPFSYLCYFLILSYVFVQHQCFWFQNKQLKKQKFLVKRGVATKRVFLWTCVLQNVKSYRFLGHFLANFGWCSKKHYKIGISAHF